MKIIRDPELGGLAMIPLLIDWGIRRCNQKDCTEPPTTIIAGAAEGVEVPVFGLCEKHFQQGNQPGGTAFDLEWNEYDAFSKEQP
ncbi:MAG TPA: hypothetical protein VJA25_01300 [Dehalococcoidia bacterium]|nr:hypothetical protein [Dehalococcoidia bacterium]